MSNMKDMLHQDYTKEVAEDITIRLLGAMFASCSCLTKTPETKYHKPTCLYRVLNDAWQEIETHRNSLRAQND